MVTRADQGQRSRYQRAFHPDAACDALSSGKLEHLGRELSSAKWSGFATLRSKVIKDLRAPEGMAPHRTSLGLTA